MSNWSEAIKEELSYINEQALFADGFDEALIGIDQVDYVAVYDVEKCIDVLMQDTGMTLEESKEYFEYNTLGAYVGEYTPRFVRVYNGL
jgi:predicted DNA repair protein MutK